MEIVIKRRWGRPPQVSVYGSSKNGPKQVAKAYKETIAELNNKGKEVGIKIPYKLPPKKKEEVLS